MFTPAASSNMLRRSSALLLRMVSTIFNSITEYALEPIPVSIKRLVISFKRQRFLFKRYSLSPERKILLEIVTSEYSVGRIPLLFSIVSETSDIPIGLRVAVPLKITFSILSERSVLLFCSPKHQRIASTILVLPHPLGPTIAVNPL